MGDVSGATPQQAEGSDDGSRSTTTATSPMAIMVPSEELQHRESKDGEDTFAGDELAQSLHDSVLTPRAPSHPAPQTAHEQDSIDYFMPSAVLSHSVSHIESSISNSVVNNGSTGGIGAADVSGANSSQSITNNSPDVRPSRPHRPRAPPRRSLTEYPPSAVTTDFPKYPDQSYSALHKSHWANESSSTSQYPFERLEGYRSILRTTGDLRPIRTADNTPAQTPGLFSPSHSRHHVPFDVVDDQSPIPSPYLHPFHRQPVKETAIAQSSVDTISGRKLINQYEIINELGRGMHGKVKLARNLEDGEYVAIKIVSRFSKRRRLGKAAANPEEKVKKEIAILKKCQHPNVVSLKEVIDDPEAHKIYIVLEYCELREVDWRCEGMKEIVLNEHRRLDAEARGLNDLKAKLKQEKQSEKIMRIASERREKERLKRPGMPERATSTFWSLEFGDSEDDDLTDGPSSAPVSRTVSRVSSIVPSDSKSDSENLSGDIELGNPFDNDPMSESSFGKHLPLSKLTDRQISYSQLSGSVHSAYDTDDSRGRHSSIAESSSSRLTELVEEEVPEDYRFVPKLTLSECRKVFRDGVLGLEYLHYQGIVHRDIKPANLLVTAGDLVKISDFGVSYLGIPVKEGDASAETSEAEGNDFDEEAELAKNVGTPAFYAPELCSLDFNADVKIVTKSIDIWALGVTLYCLLFARTPFIAEGQYALMKKIAEDDVFIPRKRLRAVKRRPGSRSKSRDLQIQDTEERRLPHRFEHEEIGEDLYDLLRRLLEKDPLKRISLMEVKHHPWFVEDIQDPAAWLHETDPQRHTQGQKIEISQQEVKDAVIPFKVIERAKSIAKKVGGVFGIGAAKASTRTRSKSGVSPSAPAPTSAPSSTGPVIRDGGRRASIRLDDSSLKAGREHHDHPLSRSHAVSPEVSDEANPFEASASVDFASRKHIGSSTASRPSMPDRQESTAASVRTIRQADIGRISRHTPSPPPPPSAFAESHLEPHGGSNLSAIFEGATRSVMRTLSRGRRGSTRSSPGIAAVNDFDPRGEPSIAFSDATAAGHVNQPQSRERSAGHAMLQSPDRSRKSSRSGRSAPPPPLDILEVSRSPSSSTGSPRHHMSPVDFGGGLSRGRNVMNDDEPSDEVYREALGNLNRRKLLELQDEAARREASRSRYLSLSACPPSPDDEQPSVNSPSKNELSEQANPYTFESSPVSGDPVTTDIPLSAVSSEDHMTPALSQSTSPPSASVSMVSTGSSLYPEQGLSCDIKDDAADLSDATTRNTTSIPAPKPFLPLTSDEDDGYAGDGDRAVQSDSDSDSGEEFLTMGRRKSQRPSKQAAQNSNVSDA